jgi:hypothetical protein
MATERHYIATVYTPHGEAMEEKGFTAAHLTDAWGAAMLWADNDYQEPYSMPVTVVLTGDGGRVMAYWLPEGNTTPRPGVHTF